jgi:hypothetical protein
MWDPQLLTTVWAFTACYRDSFAYFICVPSKLRNKTVIKRFAIYRDSVLTRVSLNVKMAGLVMKRVLTWTEITCREASGSAVMVRIFRLWWLNMQDRQTTVKRQANTASPEANTWRLRKPEPVSSMRKFSFVGIQSKSGISVSCKIIT